jgi:hypothetical protein
VPSARDALARSRRWGSASRQRITPRLRRHLGAAVVLAVVASLVVMVAIGTGYHPRTAPALDGGAWLGSSNGALVHANGTSARVDWVLAASPGMFQVIQAGTGGLVDAASGLARSIDGSNMTLSPPTNLGSGNSGLVTGGGQTYVVNHYTGLVQPVDPVTLTPSGDAVALHGPVGSTAVDGDGTLYAVLAASGTIDTISNGSIEAQISGGSPSARLVTLGTSVVEVDLASNAVVRLRADGAASSVSLGLPSTSQLAIPTAIDATLLWITDITSGTLLGIDPSRGVTQQIPVGSAGAGLGVPQVAGRLVYLVDSRSGSVLTVDPTRGGVSHDTVFPIGATATMFSKDGLVWGNDFAGAKAVVADAQGNIQIIQKYVPGKKTTPGPVNRKTPKPIHKPKRKVARVPRVVKHKPKAKKKPAVKPKKTQIHHKTPPKHTTIPSSTTSTTVCPTTTTTTKSSTSTSSSSTSTTSTTTPCKPASTTTTTDCPSTTSTSSTSSTTSTTDSSTTTEPDTTTTTDPCQPTTTSTTTAPSTTSTTAPASTTSTTTSDSTSSTQP